MAPFYSAFLVFVLHLLLVSAIDGEQQQFAHNNNHQQSHLSHQHRPTSHHNRVKIQHFLFYVYYTADRIKLNFIRIFPGRIVCLKIDNFFARLFLWVLG